MSIIYQIPSETVVREKEVTPDVASLPVLDLVLEEVPQAFEEQEQEVLGNFSNNR